MTNLLNNFCRFLLLFFGVSGLFLDQRVTADDSGIIDTPSVAALSAKIESTNIVLTWPSDARESFVVLWRSNANYQSPWIVLTNQFRVAANNKETRFIDFGGWKRLQMQTETNLLKFYAVYVIPDFWFNLQGVTISGESNFLPFYCGIQGPGFPEPDVGLVVDGEEAGWGPILIKQANFGDTKNPRWVFVRGLSFRNDLVPDGKHTLQLRSQLALNNFVGQWTQDIFLSNSPIEVTISRKPVKNSWSSQRLAPNVFEDEQKPPENEIPYRPFLLKKTLQPETKFQLDLGEVSNLVQVTPEYSNAVMSVVLPCFSDAAKKLNLPVPQPITYADIKSVFFQPYRNRTLRSSDVSVLLKNGWVFDHFMGYLHRIENLRSYAALQDPDEIPRYYGEVKMTQTEAVQMARDTLIKLGIPLEDVFAEQEPRVTPPPRVDVTNIVPHYRIEWITPRAGDARSVDIHINANTKQIERIYISNKNLGNPLKINVVPIPAPLGWPSVNPDYARQLLPMMFKAIDEYAKKLSLPLSPLTTNNVAKVSITDNEGWPHAEIETINGWRFIYRHTMVNGYYAPDNFFASDNRKIHIKDFDGKWRLTTNQAIEIVRQALKKLDYPTNSIHMADAKTFIHGASVNKEHIPRLSFEWYYEPNDDLQSRLEAEVNTDSGKLESLYYDDKAYWNSRPPIEVPISTAK